MMFRDVSVMLFGAFWVGRESLSATGALLLISLPSSRGWTSASTEYRGAFFAICSSPQRPIWAGVESSRDGRDENHGFLRKILLSIYIS